MKKFVNLLAYLSWGVLIGATLTSCLHGNVYGLFDSIDEGGGGENGSGGSSGSSNTYQQDFQKEFGSISPSQNWNMSEEGEITVSVSTSSTIYVYGTYTSGEYGSKLLGVFKDISGTQTLVFDKPSGLNSFYIVISNGLYTQGKTVTNGKSVSFSGSDDILLHKPPSMSLLTLQFFSCSPMVQTIKVRRLRIQNSYQMARRFL